MCVKIDLLQHYIISNFSRKAIPQIFLDPSTKNPGSVSVTNSFAQLFLKKSKKLYIRIFFLSLIATICHCFLIQNFRYFVNITFFWDNLDCRYFQTFLIVDKTHFYLTQQKLE